MYYSKVLIKLHIYTHTLYINVIQKFSVSCYQIGYKIYYQLLYHLGLCLCYSSKRVQESDHNSKILISSLLKIFTYQENSK